MSRLWGRGLWADGACLLALATLLVIFFWRYITPDESSRILFPAGDFIDQHFAWRYYASLELAQARLPIWTPFEDAGHPFLADIQTAILYPVHLVLPLLLWLRGNTQMSVLDMEWLGIFHFFLTGTFTYLFVKQQTGNRLAGLASGLIFTFSSYLTSYPALQPVILNVFTWIPLVLLLVARAVARGSILSWLLVALVLTVSTLAGHPQQSTYVYYLTGAFGLFAIITLVRSEGHQYPSMAIKAALPQVASLGIAMLASLSLAAAQLLPFMDFATFSSRGGDLTYAFTQSGFGLTEAVGILLPNLQGGKPLFVGSVTLILIASSIWRPRSSDALFWVGAAVVAFLLSFGGNLPFYNAAHCCLPGFAWFRDQERIVAVFSLAASVLAGYGVASILSWGPQDRDRLIRLALASIGLGAAGAVIAAVSAVASSFSDLGLAMESLFLVAVMGGASLCIYLTIAGKLRHTAAVAVLIMLATGQLLVLNWTNFGSGGEDVFRPTSLTRFLQDLPDDSRVELGDLSPNSGLVFGIRAVRGAGPLVNKYLANAEAWPDLSKGLQLLNARYAVWHTDSPESMLHWSEGLGVGALSSNSTLAYVAFRSRVETEDSRVLELLSVSGKSASEEDFVYGRDVVLSEPLDVRPGHSGFVRGPFTSTDDGGRVTVRLDSTAPGILVVSEVYDKGWKAFLDGAEARVVRANYLVLGVAVPAGPHVVQLVYAPDSVRNGFALSILTLFAMLSAATAAMPWRPRLKQISLVVLLTAASVTSVVSWQSLSASVQPTTPAQWEALSGFLEATLGPQDAIVLTGRDAASVRLPRGTKSLPADDRAALIRQPRSWWLSSSDQPGTWPGHPTPAGGFQLMGDQWFGNQFLSLMVPLDQILNSLPHPSDITLGDRVHLRGFGISDTKPESLKGGLAVSLYWQTSASLENDYAVFVQLLNGDGRLVAQNDSPPASGTRPTSGWDPGEVVLDPHVLMLPGGLAAGEYSLIAGLYDSNGKRLADPSGQDYLVLDRIKLSEASVNR